MIALVQKTAGSLDLNTTISVAFAGNVTKNNLLLAMFGGGAGVAFSGNNDSVTDTQGNVWTQATYGGSIDDNSFVTIWFAIAKATGANTVTWVANLAGAGTMNLIIAEYSGLTIAPLDQSRATTDIVGNSIFTGNINTTQAAELIVATAVSGVAVGAWSADSGFTTEQTTASSIDSEMYADNTVAAIGAYGTNISQAGGANRKVAAIASFFAIGVTPGVGKTIIKPFPRKLPWILDRPNRTEGRHLFVK